MSIGIRGGGVAAATCAHLLDAAGFAIAWDAPPRAGVPAIMLSGAALSLIRDVHGRPDLFAARPRITRRIVQWGDGPPVTLPHDAIVVSDADLQRELAASPALRGSAASPRNLTIHTAPDLPVDRGMCFGERQAEAVQVCLPHGASAEECRVEALDAGWLFLLPTAEGCGWLLGFGAPLARLMQASTLISAVAQLGDAEPAAFDTAPRLSMPLVGEDWLACGTAALRFDPICGDGTAQAVREAILASAVIGAIADGGNRLALLMHYRSMLVASMRRHLDLCARFYAGGCKGEWWRGQAAALARGHEACTRILAKMPEPRYVLRDFSLEPRSVAA